MSVTINGTSGLVFNDSSTQNTAASGFGFTNRIINGAMMIDQRNAGASVTSAAGGTFSVDRFSSFGSGGGVYTTQRSTDVPSGQGFVNSIVSTVTTSSSPTGTAYYIIQQGIEGFNTADLMWGTANAKTVTVSFWVKSSLTGTYTVALRNNALNRAYRASYTISSANTWEYKTITVAGDTTGTWLIDNNAGITMGFTLGAGSSFIDTANTWSASQNFAATGQTQWIATNGATFYITGVQLEKGSTATSFDYRPYGTELALCQRYYQTYQKPVARGVMNGTTNLGRIGLPLQVQMRASPTLNIIGTIDWFDASGVGTITALNATYTTTNAIEFDALAATGTTALGRPAVLYNGSNTGSLTASAEL